MIGSNFSMRSTSGIFDHEQRKNLGVSGSTLVSVDPQMANSPDICVMLKILSSEYQLYACGKIFRMP